MEQTAGSMSNKDKIRYLKRYMWVNREIDSKVNECERLREKMIKIIPTLSFQPPGGGSIHKSSDRDVEIIDKIIALEGQINQSIDNLIELRAEIEQVIMAQENDQERLLLLHRYIGGNSWIQVCVLMNYEWAQTHRIHSNALANLKMIHNDTSVGDIV
jgi:hypothetical protein